MAKAGIGLSRIIILAGAGYTGTVLFKKGRLSEVFGELQVRVKGLERKGKSSDGDIDAIASQVRRLAMEVRQLGSSRQVTIVNGNSGNLTNMVVLVATLGVLGYAYMWWQGYSFSDIMYVTKENMAKAVSNLTVCLNQVNEVLASAQKYLTERIEKVDKKLDDQLETSKLMRNEVIVVHDVVSQIRDDLGSVQHIVSGLYGTVCSLEDKQAQTIAGIQYLCHFVEGNRMKMPEILQRQLKVSDNYCGHLTSTDNLKLQGLAGNSGFNVVKKLHYIDETLQCKTTSLS